MTRQFRLPRQFRLLCLLMTLVIGLGAGQGLVQPVLAQPVLEPSPVPTPAGSPSVPRVTVSASPRAVDQIPQRQDPGPEIPPPGPQRTERIEAELVPLSAWVTPGSTAVVAVRQKIQPDWHTYWRNPGDSGGATSLDWTLPPGVEAGPVIWPLPERQRLQTLMNFGYSDEVYLPVTLSIPASARPGQVLRLTSRTLFMVCSDEMCVPDELTLSLDVRVGQGAAPLTPVHGPRIQSVLEAAPQLAGIEASVSLSEGRLVLTATGGPLAGAQPKWAWFFPFEGGRIDHPALQPGQFGPEGLTLVLEPGRGIGADGPTGPIGGVLSTDLGAWEILAEPGDPLTGATGSGRLADPEAGPGFMFWFSFLQAALFALLGGLILNLMPCVFPVLAMKAAALAGGAHAPREARRDGLAFLFGVLSTFLILAVGLLLLRAAGQAVGWGFQLQSPGVVAGLSLLMLAVGLNLSGVYQVGQTLQAAGSGPLSRLPGGSGSFFTGVLAVVVAAPCTAPFMAFALGAALVMPWPMALVIFLMLGLGLALPYVLVSLSPRLLARLPRPGPWMERLKGLLAFPMYGAALWLVWVFARQAGDRALGLLFLAGLLLALGLWLAGSLQDGRAAGAKTGFSRLGAIVSLIAAAVLTGLSLAQAQSGPGSERAGASGALASQPWSAQAVRAAQAEGRPVLVNFTADWCVTCKINEGAALSSTRTARALQAVDGVYLLGDWTLRDDAITAELERHGRSGVPLYLVYPSDGGAPRILPQILTEGVIIEALQSAAALRRSSRDGLSSGPGSQVLPDGALSSANPSDAVLQNRTQDRTEVIKPQQEASS